MNLTATIKPATGSWKDYLLAAGVILAIGLLVASVAVGVVAAAAGWSASDNSGQVARQSAIGNCRTEKYGQVVNAGTQLDLASAELQVLLSTGLAASVDTNESALLEIAALVPAAALRVTDAASVLNQATEGYVEATALAASDPEAFLEQCRS